VEITAAIRTHLLEQAAIVALVEDRIVPVRYAQGLAYPLVVVQAFRTQHLHTQRRAAGTAQTRVQFDIYAQDREDGASGIAQAWAIAAAIRAELGHVAARNLGGADVRSCLVDSENESEATQTDEAGEPLAAVRAEYLIWHRL
jgi:hypothetical protein